MTHDNPLDFAPDIPPESFETARPVAVVRRQHEIAPRATDRVAKPQREPQTAPQNNAGPGSRPPPHSLEAEEQLLSCCLIDGLDSVSLCLEHHLPPKAFFSPENRLIYERILALYAKAPPVELAVLVEDLRAHGLMSAAGGMKQLMKVSTAVGTTAQAAYFIDRVKNTWMQREIIMLALGAAETAYHCQNPLEMLADVRTRIDGIGVNGVNGAGHGLFTFAIPGEDDRSVLLGNRYLNRGDGGVLVSTSGMGKSSLSLQAASNWALGRAFMGIKPNGALTSVVVQAEDSDGDVAEVSESIKRMERLTLEQIATVNQKVIVHTERVARGQAFLSVLRRLIGKYHPDLVWINPLQAFIEGDVTDAEDLSSFLRAGLNSLNEPPSFGYIVVHHTTKPATGRDRQDRLWHEVMYDMAGGAEIINWARFIMSLRAAENEGEFNLVLAKRGRRAGVTKQVDQGAGAREELITTIPIKHTSEKFVAPGHRREIQAIYWEPRVAAADEGKSSKGGAPEKFPFSDLRSIFPQKIEPAKKLAELHRAAMQNVPITAKSFHSVLQRYKREGLIEAVEEQGQAVKYRLAV